MLKNNGMPWFEFKVNDWLTSEDVMDMSMAERGVYITLLANQWRSDNELPADPNKIAMICGTDARAIRNWLKKWERLFPILHVAGCQCEGNAEDTLPVREVNGGAAPTSRGRCVDVAWALRPCNKRANAKLLNIRKNKELQNPKPHRQDKTREDKRKRDETTSAAQEKDDAAAADASIVQTVEYQVETMSRVQYVVQTWNQLEFASAYTIPSEQTPVLSNLQDFVARDGWKSQFKELVNAYTNSSFLQRGGKVGLNSLAWLFNKDWVRHIEEITSGKYRDERDFSLEQYKHKNSYLVNTAASDTELNSAGFKTI